jgi:hypothetical protein
MRLLQQVHRVLVFWDITPCHWVGPFAFNSRNIQEEHLYELSTLAGGSIPILPDVEKRPLGDRTSQSKA